MRANRYAVIPAGGSGTRLWPLSRSGRPKFLLDLTGTGRTLLQSTADRLAAVVEPGRTLVVTGAVHAAQVARELPEIDADNIVVEPAARNTAPAIGLAAALIRRRDPDAVMGSFAADHLVADTEAFAAAVRTAYATAERGYLVTIGLTPTAPETGYGYLRRDEPLAVAGAYRVAEFVEKPSLPLATSYLRDGGYLWNASMFVWRPADFLAELDAQLPEVAAGVRAIAADWDTSRREDTMAERWHAMPAENVDQGVMEDAALRGRVAVVPAQLGWQDVGDFDTLARVSSARGLPGRLGAGQILSQDTESSLVVADSDRLVATLGLRDMVVVDTPDALLVCPRDRAQDVKAVVAELRATGRADLV